MSKLKEEKKEEPISQLAEKKARSKQVADEAKENGITHALLPSAKSGPDTEIAMIPEEEEIITKFENVENNSYANSEDENKTDVDDDRYLSNRDLSDEDDYDTDLEIDDGPEKAYKSLTCRDVYLKSCEQLGVVPSTFFIKHLDDEKLCMPHHGLGPIGAKAIAAPLVVNTTILELDIQDNWITSAGMRDIADMLNENCYITHLNVAQNKLGILGARYTSDMLQENTTLRRVNLARNGFNDRAAKFFSETIKLNFRLKELDVSGNEFCERGGEFMGQMIAANEALEVVNLSWNHLRRKGAIAIAAGMKVNITIRTLNLSWNGFGDEGAMAMGEALKTNNTLSWLDLSSNRITGRGAAAFAKGLEVNDNLRTLRMGENPVGPDGAICLLKAICNNQKSAIEELDLKGVRVNKEFVYLAQQLKSKAASSTSGSKTNFAYVARQVGDPVKERIKELCDPMMAMQKFLESRQLRFADVFRFFDEELSFKISVDDFRNAIVEAGAPLTTFQLNTLIGRLDLDDHGLINYKVLDDDGIVPHASARSINNCRN